MAKPLSSLKKLVGMKRPVLGLDIGSDSIKAVEVKPTGSGIRVVRSAVVPVSAGHRGELNDEDLIAALRRLVREQKFGTRRVATAVAGEAVIVRVLRMPAMAGASADEVRFAVQSEAQDFIPFDMEDVIFDYQLLGAASVEGADAVEAVIVAVRKDVVERMLRILDEAGLETAVIDVSSFALCNALAYGGAFGPDEVVALVSIGAATTSVAILRNGLTRFTRDLTVAGRSITNAIANELGVSFRDAEKLKMHYGISLDQPVTTSRFGDTALDDVGIEEQSAISHDPLDGLYIDPVEEDAGGESGIGSIDAVNIYGDVPDAAAARDPETIEAPAPAEEVGAPDTDARERDCVSEICAHYLGEISSEVKRSFIYYENQLDGEPVNRIILCGGSSQMPNAAPYLTGVLDIPTEAIPSIARVDWGSVGDTEQTRSMLGVSVGLALRGVLE